jgi:hypothetical protein
MKSSNRFLLGFGIGVAVLIVITIALVLATRNNVTLLPADTPEGVAQRFLQALQSRDYPEAFKYLKVTEPKTGELTYSEWLPTVQRPSSMPAVTWRATLDKTTITGATATVGVSVDLFESQGPFEDPVRTQNIIFNLTKIEGTWYITTRPPIYWIY